MDNKISNLVTWYDAAFYYFILDDKLSAEKSKILPKISQCNEN